jgi:hypothetical protein
MTSRRTASLFLTATLLGGVSIPVQSTMAFRPAARPASLSLTLDPVAPHAAQLRYAAMNETISAQAQVMKVTYTSIGLEVELRGGSVTFSENGKDPVTRPFHVWELKFSEGQLISSKLNARGGKPSGR